MTLFNKLLGKKNKKKKVICRITKSPIDEGYGYLLSTAQIISSKKYWDLIMTEPETLSYTISHFKSEETGTRIRSMIFEKYSTIDSPWIISDECIGLFEEVDSVDKTAAKNNAKEWWESEGNYSSTDFKPAEECMNADEFKLYRDYAILEAGRSRVIERI